MLGNVAEIFHNLPFTRATIGELALSKNQLPRDVGAMPEIRDETSGEILRCAQACKLNPFPPLQYDGRQWQTALFVEGAKTLPRRKDFAPPAALTGHLSPQRGALVVSLHPKEGPLVIAFRVYIDRSFCHATPDQSEEQRRDMLCTRLEAMGMEFLCAIQCYGEIAAAREAKPRKIPREHPQQWEVARLLAPEPELRESLIRHLYPLGDFNIAQLLRWIDSKESSGPNFQRFLDEWTKRSVSRLTLRMLLRSYQWENEPYDAMAKHGHLRGKPTLTLEDLREPGSAVALADFWKDPLFAKGTPSDVINLIVRTQRWCRAHGYEWGQRLRPAYS